MADENPQTIEAAGQRQPWDRRKDESKRAWTAFVLFRDSTTRRLAEVAKALIPPCSVPNVARWSMRYNWQQRAGEFDVYMDELHLAEMARGRLAHRRRQIQLGSVLQSVAAHGLRELQAKIEQQLPLNLAPTELAALLKLGDEMETRGLGEEREGSKYTKINVILTGYEDEQQYEDALRTGGLLLDGDPKKKPN